MTIKSDKWIRKMVQEKGMIDPFEPNQVRTNKDKRLISYGTSSYGYDVRCSNQFKIFTNIFGNNITRESVIRNSLEIDEGDPYNQILQKSTIIFQVQ